MIKTIYVKVEILYIGMNVRARGNVRNGAGGGLLFPDLAGISL